MPEPPGGEARSRLPGRPQPIACKASSRASRPATTRSICVQLRHRSRVAQGHRHGGRVSQRGSRVLDLCAGTGDLTFALAAAGTPSRSSVRTSCPRCSRSPSGRPSATRARPRSPSSRPMRRTCRSTTGPSMSSRWPSACATCPTERPTFRGASCAPARGPLRGPRVLAPAARAIPLALPPLPERRADARRAACTGIGSRSSTSTTPSSGSPTSPHSPPSFARRASRRSPGRT